MTYSRIDNEGNKLWYDSQGEFHRDEGPAQEIANGTKFWYKHGLRHREDGPAVELADGTKHWWLNNRWIT